MNVYVYQGNSRDTATTPFISSNSQPSIGYSNYVSPSSGLMIVAYPSNLDVDTELEFEYWVTAPS